MFKLFIFACIIAFAAAEAKPGPSFIGDPLAYSAHLTYPSSYVYGSPIAYTGYAPSYYNNYYSPYAYNYGSYFYRK